MTIKYFCILFQKGSKLKGRTNSDSEISHIWNVHRIFMFCPNWCSFFLWIGCAGSMSSFLYLLWFQRQTHVKGANKSWIPKLELSYLCCFFGKMVIFMVYWWPIEKNCYIIFERGTQSQKFAYLEGIFHTWNSKSRQMSKI